MLDADGTGEGEASGVTFSCLGTDGSVAQLSVLYQHCSDVDPHEKRRERGMRGEEVIRGRGKGENLVVWEIEPTLHDVVLATSCSSFEIMSRFSSVETISPFSLQRSVTIRDW